MVAMNRRAPDFAGQIFGWRTFFGLALAVLGGCDAREPEPSIAPADESDDSVVIQLASLPVERVETVNEWRDARRLPPGESRALALGSLPANAVLRAGFRGATAESQFTGQLLIGDTPVLDLSVQGDVWQDGRIDLAQFNAAGQSCRIVYTADTDFWMGPGELITPSSERPNILFFLIDTVRQDHMSCYGYQRKTTPNLDAFLRDAVRFTQLVPQSSWTRPSIASYFTSTYPAEHGAVDNTDSIRDGLPRLAESLAAAGYECHGFVSNLNTLPQWGFAEGFTRYVDLDSMQWYRTDPAHVVDSAIFTMSQAQGRPWFQFVHSIGAHHPYHPPEAYFDSFQTSARGKLTRDDVQHMLDTCAEERPELYSLLGMRPGDASLRDPANTVENVVPIVRQAAIDWYDGEIAYNDGQFQRLVDALEQLGAYDNTIIIVASDHGEEFWEHGGTEHGYTLYEEQLRVPFIVKLADSELGGTTVDSIVEGVDLAPTILEAIGAAPEPRFRGRSVLPVMRGETQEPRLGFAALNLRQFSIRAVKSPTLKNLIYPLESKSEWFDLSRDPFEQSPIEPPESAKRFDAYARAAGVVGAEGVHLYIKCELAKEQTFEGRIVSDSLNGFELRHSDGLGESETTPDGLRFHVEMKPAAFYPFESMVGRKAWQDIHLYAAVGGAATLAIDLRVDGEPVSVASVEAGPDRGPVPLDGSLLTVSALAAPPVAYDKGRFPDEFGVYLWYVRGAADRGSETLDPEMEEALRGMGYLE